MFPKMIFFNILVICLLAFSAKSSDAEVRCIERMIRTPSETALSGELSERFGGEAARAAVGQDIWDDLLEAVLAGYHERDLYCILGPDATPADIEPFLDLGGGEAFLLMPQDVASGPIASLAPQRADLVAADVDVTPPDILPELIKYYPDDCSRKVIGGESQGSFDDFTPLTGAVEYHLSAPCNRRRDAFNKKVDERRRALAPVVDAYAPPPRSEIKVYVIDSANPGAALRRFVSTIDVREAMMAALYRQDEQGSIVSREGESSASGASARSWIAGELHDVLEPTSLRQAEALLRAAARTDITDLDRLTIPVERVRTAPLPFPQAGNIWFAHEVVAALCSRSLDETLRTSASNSREAERSAGARGLLCGVRSDEGVIVYRDPWGAQGDPEPLIASIEAWQSDKIGQNISRQIALIRAEMIEQSALLGDILRFEGKSFYADRQSELNKALAAAKREAEKNSGLSAIVDGIELMLPAASGVVKGFEILDNVVDDMPSGFEPGLDHLWSSRDRVSNGADSIFEGVSDFEEGYKKVEGAIRGSDSKVTAIQGRITDLERERDAFLDAVAKRSQAIGGRRAALDAALLEREAITNFSPVAPVASRVVAMNLVSHWGADRILQQALVACAKVFEEARAAGSVSAQRIEYACLAPARSRLDHRQEAVVQAMREPGADNALVIDADGTVLYLAPVAAQSAFGLLNR